MNKKVAWKKTTQFEGPEESPGFLLWQVSVTWRRLIEKQLAQFDLTHPQFVLLASIGWLTRDQEEVTQVVLARHCNMDINMTSQVLRSLEKKEFIKRKSRKDNARAKFSYLTALGVKTVEKALPTVEAVDQDFFKRLGAKEKTQLIRAFQKLASVTTA